MSGSLLLVAVAGMVTVPIALAASAMLAVSWQGRWRKLAAVPVVGVMAYFGIVLLPDWMRDSTSHNLFPFEIGLVFSPSGPYMLIVYWLHRRSGADDINRVLKCANCGTVSRPGPSRCEECGGKLVSVPSEERGPGSRS
ncbi:MAG: hypothetical protein EPO35_00605 [Acidobacteria bacterium]|nr:MAG: hypothetical protein EPO35_00605 [Acidobacteriota bacterium]